MKLPACPVSRAARHAVADAQALLEARGVVVDMNIRESRDFSGRDDVVRWSVYTIIRGLAARAVPTSTLRIESGPKAGGDIELVVEAVEGTADSVPDDQSHEEALIQGEHADLVEVALAALESVCRARGGLMAIEEDDPDPRTTRRRYMFLIPSAERRKGAYEAGLRTKKSP